MSRVVLAILGVVAVLIVGGVFAWQTFSSGEKTAASAAPKIAIVTADMLSAAKDAAASDRRAAQVEFQRITADGREKQQNILSTKDQSDDGVAGVASASSQPPGEPAPQAQAGDYALLQSMLSDQMEALISKALTESRRFSVMDASTVRSSIAAFAATPATPNRENSVDVEGERKEGASLVDVGVSAARGLVVNNGRREDSATASGEVQVAGANSRPDLSESDLASAAAKLQARYLLYVSVESPQTTFRLEFSDSKLFFREQSDPVFVYRLVDVQENRTVLSEAAKLDRPVEIEVPVPNLNNSLLEANFKVDITRARRELTSAMQAEVAQRIAAHVLDVTFPTRLISESPLTINRGSNDGVTEGETISIFRTEGERAFDTSENGVAVALEASERFIGSAKVTALRPNAATIEPLGDIVPRKGDIIRRAGRGDESSSASDRVQIADGGLGKNDILANRANAEAGADLVLARLAVGALQFRSDVTLSAGATQFQQALTSRLSRERRIEVLSREALDQLRSEQSLGNSRNSYRRGGDAIAKAGYLVLGSVAISSSRRGDTVVPGAEPRNVRTYLRARSTLRIERLDSRVIDSFEVAAEVPISGAVSGAEAGRAISEAFAQEAAKAILPRLFPIEVAQLLDGGALVLNRGADIGLKSGDILTLYKIGDPITDPTTGTRISEGVRSKVAVARITDVQDTLSTAVLVGAASSPVNVGAVAERGGTVPAPAGAASGARRPASSKTEPTEGAVPW